MAITMALESGTLAAVSCTFPETFSFWEKEEIVLMNNKQSNNLFI
jgi:hypothetical protein